MFAERDRLTPVIIGVGEVVDRPNAESPREPARLMANALREAERDAGASLLDSVASLDIVQEISWPYTDPAARVSREAGIAPARTFNGLTGGESPLRYIHEAALRVAAGVPGISAICGAEAEASVRAAKRAGATLPWSECDENFVAIRAGASQRPVTRALQAAIPVNVYPLYESATRAAWGQDFTEAEAESAELWAQLSQVADSRACSWQTHRRSADEIMSIGPDNRAIAWPYPKLMVANPIVNQGAAVLVTSLAEAEAAGVPRNRMIYIVGGSAAEEPGDLLLRSGFDRSEAMHRVLTHARSTMADLGRSDFDHVELYSCFPCVPKMARRALHLAPDMPISVTGGLTFFGAPLNNYMTHAVAAMADRLRAGTDAFGLLYGQGGYVTRHHALILSSSPPPDNTRLGLARAEPVPAFEGEVRDGATGAGRIEACTVIFERDGTPRHGVVIARLQDGARAIGGVPGNDLPTLGALMDREREPVGRVGALMEGAEAFPRWVFD